MVNHSAALAAAGAIDLAFAVFHIMFWRMFGWAERLPASGRLNAAITQTMNVMLIYTFAAYGGALVYFAWKGAMVLPALLWAGAVFWALRALLQPMLFTLRDRRSVAMLAIFALATVTHVVAARACEAALDAQQPERSIPLGRSVQPS